MIDKKSARLRRATKARAKMEELGATRLVVFRTPRHIYAQIIAGGQVLAAASTLEKDLALRLTVPDSSITAVSRLLPMQPVKQDYSSKGGKDYG